MPSSGSRLSPHRLARLANALGVSTPLPLAAPSPNPAPVTSNHFLLHVVPPAELAPAPAPPHHFLRGTLVPLHSTLHAQLAAIAREYALPSTAGLVLYLLSDPDQQHGPRLSDDIWRLLWSRVASAERSPSPSPLRPLTCSPSPSTPSSSRSPFKSPSEPDSPDSSLASPPVPALLQYPRDLPLPGLTSPSLLPILAKVEFDIDKRRATWYTPWINSRLKKRSASAPLQLLTAKRSEMLRKDPLGLKKPPSPIDPDEEEDDELDEDATATFVKQTSTTGSHSPLHDTHQNITLSTEEEEVLDMLETMSVRSKSTSSSRSSSSHSSLARMVVLPPLPINSTNANIHDGDIEQSYLAYTEPQAEESLPIISNKESQGGKREFAVFDDLELEFDHIDEDDPNDRRKSQLIMRAELDEIERTMAQLSPRMLHSDLSLSPERTSLRVSLTSSKGLEFLSPRSQNEEHNRSFITSSPPRLGFRRSDEDDKKETQDVSWPALPFSVIKEKEQSQTGNANPNAMPPPPRLAVNGVSTAHPRAFLHAPTRPPPPPPLTMPMTETEKRRREVEEDQGVYELTVGRNLPLLETGGGVIPLSPDPFGRYPSSSPNEPPPDFTEEVLETRARSGTVTNSKSRFSADSGDQPSPVTPAGGGQKPTSNITTLMSVRTIKKLWRRSKDKEKNLATSGEAPPPTPVTPTLANFASSADSNEIDKSLPSIPPPRPSRPSEEQLDFPDISMQAALPPRLTPSPSLSSRKNGDGALVSANGGGNGRKTPLGQELLPTGRRTPQEQLALSPPSRPSLDQLTAPIPSPTSTRPPPPPQQQGSATGRRTPQDQITFRPHSRPSLDQPAASPTLTHTPPPQQQQTQPGSGRRTPQDQLMFRPPSRPSLDQLATPPPPALTHAPPPQQQPLGNGSGRRTPQDQLMFPQPPLDQRPPVPISNPHAPPTHPSHPRRPSQPQPPMHMPMFQGRNPNNGPVKPLLAMHYPSRSSSVSQQRLDVNRLLFDQESPYPVRLASTTGGGTQAATVSSTTKVAAAPAASYVGGSVGAVVSPSPPPPPPQPQRPPSVEPEKPTAISTMRKSILKWKLANPNANGNPNLNGNVNPGSSDTSSSSSSSSTSSSSILGAVPRQSFERFERPGTAGSGYGHHQARGGGGRRPSVINFGSTSSLSSSTSVSSNRGGADIPPNPQVPAQYSGGESKPNFKPPIPNSNPHPSISTPSPTPMQNQNQNQNQEPPPSLSLSLPIQSQPTPSAQSLSPSRQSFDSQTQHSAGSAAERRSNASSFDMTQFEFVSPMPSPAPPTHVHGPLRA